MSIVYHGDCEECGTSVAKIDERPLLCERCENRSEGGRHILVPWLVVIAYAVGCYWFCHALGYA